MLSLLYFLDVSTVRPRYGYCTLQLYKDEDLL